jgi:hypothetical protein
VQPLPMGSIFRLSSSPSLPAAPTPRVEHQGCGGCARNGARSGLACRRP